MKKYIIYILFFATALFLPSAQAVDITNNYNGYVVKNHTFEETEKAINLKLESISIKATPIKDTPNAYYEVSKKNEHYYIRFYPANKDTNIYIVSEKKFDFENNNLTDVLNSLNYTYTKLEDKDALKEYQFDFIDLARNGTFEGFFVLPDYLKPLKKGVSDINNFISKKTKKKALQPYCEDTKEITLNLINTKNYTDIKQGIMLTSKEYRLKNKENKYVHAFEYTIKNTGSTPLTLIEASGESIASMRDIETTAAADLDRINLLDSLGSFPPILILSAGASLGLKVPNYIRLIKITKESSRFTKELPTNKTITQNSTLRILVMKFKNEQKPLIFKFERQGKLLDIEL